jgi:hypothetical protein
MNASKLLLAAALAATLAGGTAFAAIGVAPASFTAASPTIPVPTKVVHPTGLPSRYENANVELTFILDTQGVPHEVRPVGLMASDLAARLLPAVSQWRFTPLTVNGHAVRGRVVLPLTLVDGT